MFLQKELQLRQTLRSCKNKVNTAPLPLNQKSQLYSQTDHAKPHTASENQLVLGEKTTSGPLKGSSSVLTAIPRKTLQ